MSTHELDRLTDFFKNEQKKLDFELKHALARVELLQKQKAALEARLNQAQADYFKQADYLKRGKNEQANA